MSSNRRLIALAAAAAALVFGWMLATDGFRSGEQAEAPVRDAAGQDVEGLAGSGISPSEPVILQNPGAAGVIDPAAAFHAIGEFRQWASRFVSAKGDARLDMVADGVRLAEAHRSAMKLLITTDPRAALEQAVPMVVRQQLPADIVSKLEKRVAATVPMETLAVSPDSDPVEPRVRRFATIDGQEYRAWVYGKNSALRTMGAVTIYGVAVERQLAVAEEPARRLEVGEVPDQSKAAVQVCPVSGQSTEVERAADGTLPAITEETPAVEAGTQIIYLCDGGHFRQLVEDIRESERTAAEGATGGPAASTGAFPITNTTSTGVRKLLYMRVAFPDRLSEPQSESSAYANVKTLTDYYQEQSYGRTAFAGTVTPLLVLPRSEAWYITDYNTTTSNNPIMNDAKEAARAAGFPPEDYQHYTVIYAGGPGSFGGLGSVGGGSAWLKTTSVGTFEHEIGHNVGVWHSNFWNTSGASVIGPGANVEYGHIKDVMGSSGSGGHFNASMKEQLKWITPENYHTVLQSGTYRIFQFDQPNQDPARRYSLKVAKDADRDYWVEFRQKFSTNPWWTNGASLNWSPWGNGSGSSNTTAQGSNLGTQLLDTTPGSPDDREDSPVAIGRTFSDFEAGVHITPIGKGGTTPESLDVVVNVGGFPGNQTPTLALSADTVAIAAGGTVNFTATAMDADGDALAYYWEFGDKLASFSGFSFSTNNAATQSKTYASAGYYLASCTVSDMKGGSVKKTILITVGSPSTFTISGTVTDGGGAPVRDVRVSNSLTGSSMRWCYTDSDGNYTITNLAAGSVTISALKGGYSFAASGFANPVAVGPNKTGVNFTAAQGTFVSISAPDPGANEGGDTATFRITRTGDTSAALVVYTDITGSAASGSDYTLSPAADTATTTPLELFTIPAGSATLDVTLTPVNDSTQEGPETVVMSLVNGGAYIPSGPQTATVTIDDNDTTKPRVGMVATVPETTEGSASPAQFTVSRTGDTGSALTVNFTVDTSTGSAANGTDYTGIGTSVTIPGGASSAVINIATIDDSAVEGMELVKLTLSSNANYILSASTTATIKINDDDINTVTLAATDASASESGDPGRFTFTRTGDTTAALTVYYGIGGSANHGVDYRALPGFVTFAAGSTTATVDILPVNDSHGEPSQTVTLQIRSAVQYAIGGTGNATVSITDDSDLPVVAVAATDAQAAEGASPNTGTFTFTTTGTGSGNITVRYTVSGTATAGADYTALSGTLTMAKNATATVTVTPINDSLTEDAETVTLTITADPAYRQDLQNTATVVIADDDAPNMVSVSTTSASVSETVAGKFYFSRTGSTTNAITVLYSVGGTAEPGTDYTALSGSVVIAAGSSGTYVDVTPVNDALPEGAETIVVSLQADTTVPKLYGIAVGGATMTMADNDSGFPGSVGFAATSAAKSEGAGTFTIDVARTGSTAGAASVEYGVQAGTALGNGVDYLCPPGRLDFADGEAVKSITFTIVDDNIPEDIETVNLILRNANGAAITAAAAQFTVIIVDNEPRVTIEATDPFASEGGGTAQFTVRRWGGTSGALVVPVSVSGTATSGADYTALPSSVTIPDGAATAALTLTPLTDSLTEGPETVIVSLASSGNSAPGPQASATAWIADAQSDNPPFIQIVSPKRSNPAIPSGVGLSIVAQVADDGLPASLTTTWSVVSGPGTATFSAPAQPSTDVIFSAAGTYVLQLTANDGTLSSTATLTVTAGAASLPWTNTDIGTIGLPGSGAEQGGIHSANGAGSTLTGPADAFFLRSRRLAGDGEIRARVRYVPNTGGARVGVMLRESTAAGSRSAAMLLSPVFSNTSYFNYRTTTSGSAGSVSTSGVTPSWWVRVTRSGNSFAAYDSPDGITWTQRGATQTISMASDILAGVAVTSGTTTKLNTALVDNVSIIGTADNTAATVSAGTGGSVSVGTAFALDGALADDALPSIPGATTVQWTQRSGPGTASIAAASAVDTTATFPLPGSYVMRITADDGEALTFAESSITAVGPTVTVNANIPAAAEFGLVAGQITFSRTGPTASPLAVSFTKGGTAGEGADYQPIGTQIIIPAGAASATLDIAPLADAQAEGNETAVVALAADPSYTVGAASSATVTIADVPLDAWRFAQFGASANSFDIAGDDADPNHNGMTNLMEYALALDPNASGSAGNPAVTRTATTLSITFTRRINAPEIALIPEWSGSLSSPAWSSEGFTLQVMPLDATRETVTASVPISSSVNARFIHLKVTRL